VSVTDGSSSANLAPFSLTVQEPALSITGTPKTFAVGGTPYDFTPTVTGGSGSYTFSIQNKPSWASFNSSTGELSGTVPLGAATTYSGIAISVSDGTSSATLSAFSISVAAALVITGTPALQIEAGQPFNFVPVASGGSGSYTFSIQNKPSWATFDPQTGALSGVPTATNTGSYGPVSISVTDGMVSATLPPFTLTVYPPLTISGSPLTLIAVGQAYAFTPSVTGGTGKYQFSIQNKPAWASFSTSSGTLSGTPISASSETSGGIVISATDGVATVSLPSFSITVQSTLTISGSPASSVLAGSPYSFTPTVSGGSGSYTFSVQGLPAWASFDTTTGAITGTPSSADAGTYTGIVITVSDGLQKASLGPFTVTVPNSLSISGTPDAISTTGQAYSFTPTASGGSGNYSFSIKNKPLWMSFSTTTGALTGTPSSADVAEYVGIVISVSDGTTSQSLPAFTITVQAPLTISGTPAAEAFVGQLYSFTPTVSGGSLNYKFSASGLPTWLSFNSATGAISGTPTSANVGTINGIDISVNDGTTSATLPQFSLTVEKPLSITGNPDTSVTVGQPYSFTPTASGGSGPYTFSIENTPPWASFNTTTGALTGTPSAGDVGTDSNIVISVSDGVTSASLAPFSITVVAQSAGPATATVSWTIPTTNTDGTPLTDLAGFNLYYGTSPSAMTNVIDIPNPSVDTYVVTGLTSGTWYFVLTSYTTSGTMSVPSNIASKTFP